MEDTWREVLFDVAEGWLASPTSTAANQKLTKLSRTWWLMSRVVGWDVWLKLCTKWRCYLGWRKTCDDWGKDVSQVESRWCDSQVVDYETFLWMHHTVLHLKNCIFTYQSKCNLTNKFVRSGVRNPEVKRFYGGSSNKYARIDYMSKTLTDETTNQPISRFASCAQVAVSKRTSSAGWGTNGAGRFQGQVRNLQFHRPEPIISHYI